MRRILPIGDAHRCVGDDRACRGGPSRPESAELGRREGDDVG